MGLPQLPVTPGCRCGQRYRVGGSLLFETTQSTAVEPLFAGESKPAKEQTPVIHTDSPEGRET